MTTERRFPAPRREPAASGAMANAAVDGAAPLTGPGGGAGWRLAAGVLLPALTAAVAVTGLLAHGGAGFSPSRAVAFGLTLAWALAAAVITREARIPQWQMASGALVAAVALAAGRIAGPAPPGRFPVPQIVATLAALLLPAVCVHFLLALPDGRLGGQARRAGAGLAYLAAAGTGLALVIAHRPLPVAAGAVIWAVALASALPAPRLRYVRAGGHDRERMQWLAIGLVAAADVALVCAVLHLLVGWPGPVGAVAAGATVVIPLGLLAAQTRLSPYGARLLVHLLPAAGFSAVTAAVYVVIVLGFGRSPDSGDREILGLSMLAAAVAAVAYLPARDRLMASATRCVYGAREPPDAVLRTFGSRMTRAVAMDELLLQLAESLRASMGLACAEIYTGSGDVLERTVSVPGTGRRSILVSGQGRPVITRAGVSGKAWASVWLPSLLEGRGQSQLRVAPISHAGELLGLIVTERRAGADAFTEEDDRVLAELARQAGLALHNVQLDTALQTSLDELRKQADELRESRARIVATGDAERRRVERDLHDGAQQHLVALAVNLRLARDVVADDPSAGADILAQLGEDVQATIRELRELAHGIYPPLLADAGLAEALRAAASRGTQAVTVTADGIGRYPPGVETAVYFCCLEALQNSAKHAPGAAVRVRLWEEAGGLLFSISDDGPGFEPADARSGHGFVNMADRLGAFGGTVRWDSGPGRGSTISGSLPVI